MEAYRAAKGWRTRIVHNLGSGMNYRKKGLNQLLELIMKRLVTISKRAGKYFASILVETQGYDQKHQEQESVGMDFGIKDLAVCSSGQIFAANQKLKHSLKRLARKQRAHSRKVKGSNRRAKAKRGLAKLHYRIHNQRLAMLHEVSDYLVAHFKIITLEDLNVRGMTKNHKLALAVNNAGFGMLHQFIEYKAGLRG